jgi:replicative DNA helicase
MTTRLPSPGPAQALTNVPASERRSAATSVTTATTTMLADARRPDAVPRTPAAVGFDLVDQLLDGGLGPHDLMLMGGAPGVGKTIAALQMARHLAMQGRTAVFVSYEHDEPTLIGRLLALELGERVTPETVAGVDRVRRVLLDAARGYRNLDEVLRTEPLAAEAFDRLGDYGDRLQLVRASGAHTDLAAITALLEDAGAGAVVFVDYLQKVAVHPEPQHEAEKITRVAEGLKDLALDREVAIVALVAADRDGLHAGRVRLRHLRGSSALAYECDVAIILNDKQDAVSRVHLAYDRVRAESFKQVVVFSVEKNRGGPAMVDLEFRKDFLHYRFDPRGAYMTERSIDDRLEADRP